MKSIDKIPTGKIERASKLLKTGLNVGVNYAKYYGQKSFGDENKAKEELDRANAEDIYDSLKTLKGSALKVAQMLSMEKTILPKAYVEKFSLAQFSVPPLSAPLVVKSFVKSFGKSPYQIFDQFSKDSVNAASIGQVHRAEKDGKSLAVKIQYPGVAQSISSDLAMVKPIAMQMFNIPKNGSEQYFKEVEDKLYEECNYQLELQQGIEVADKCSHIPNLLFPRYYSEYSSSQILTMDWMEGKHLSEFTKVNKDQILANKLGQALWDFYMYQIHEIRKVHADPHPGNFLVSPNGELIVIDFGCMKEIPESFYVPYFEMAQYSVQNNPSLYQEKLFELEILKDDDSEEDKVFLTAVFKEMIQLFTKPFNQDEFDFGDPSFFGEISELSSKFADDKRFKKLNGGRGSKHFLYMNRTFFGLYSLMYDLKAKITIDKQQLKNAS